MDSYPEELLNALCSNPEMLNFTLGYLKKEHSAKGGFTEKELEEKFPLFLQWDERWGYVSYGESCIGLSGCAPTCLSMVIVTLTNNKEATPDRLAVYAQEAGYYVKNTGTAWSFMTEGVTYFGVEGRELSLSKNSIFQELEQGHPIICSMAPGDFTSQGHFIVLVKVQDGKIMVNDPNSIERSSVLWDYEVLEPQIKNLWTFSCE
ncbi:MAG: C39 family peptidase [Lachnospiraceae bacterium]|nr:C39 family peptidase [Lachnospiraceae bacterium]